MDVFVIVVVFVVVIVVVVVDVVELLQFPSMLGIHLSCSEALIKYLYRGTTSMTTTI